ncbi:MAG: glutamyl-tRNA reductase [bacterium]
MSFIVVGTNYKKSPVEVREKIVFRRSDLPHALFSLKKWTGISTAIILSTCNRVEVYAEVNDIKQGINKIKQFIMLYHRIDRNELDRYLYSYNNEDALKHFMQVSSGLDSMVIGETQIKTQVKNAFEESVRAGLSNENLHTLSRQALKTVNVIHNTTDINKGKVSVGSVAVDFIQEKRGSLANAHIIIIGTGKITNLVTQYLSQKAARIVFVATRTFEKAQYFADQFGGKAVTGDRLKDYLKNADIVISATASPHFILKPEHIKEINHEIFMLDLAVPRDIDPDIQNNQNIRLFTLDDLNEIIAHNKEKKNIEIRKAECIIEHEVEKLWKQNLKLEHVPALLP